MRRCTAYLEHQILPACLQRHTPSQQLVNLRNFSCLQPAIMHSAPFFVSSSALPLCPQLKAFNSIACRSGTSLLKAENRQPVHTTLQQVQYDLPSIMDYQQDLLLKGANPGWTIRPVCRHAV